jgi:hypothetical protein
MIKSAAEFGFFRTLDEDGATPGRNDRESRQDGDFCVSWRSWIINSAEEPEFVLGPNKRLP